MPYLRLFAGLKEIAGSGRLEISGHTVEEVVAEAGNRFGRRFTELADRSRIWVNGEETIPDQTLLSDDEVSILPPVSGG